MGEDRRWSQVNSSGSSPSPRSGAASVIVDAHMYIFGGYGGGGRLDDFHCFDLDNTRWSCVEPSSGLTPGMRENNGLIEFRGKLYLFGGYNGQQWLNDLFSFDLFTKEWHNVDQSGITQGLRVNHILLNSGQPPASRFGYVSVVHNNFFVVFGGYDGSTWLNDMHQYDFETWTWCAVQATGQIPSIRSCPSWCKEGDSVFVFGGYDGVQRMNDLFECNLETHTWRQLTCGGAVPSPRYFHACAIYGGRMVTFGGYNGAERLNDMHEYSFATSLWTKLDVSEGDVPSGRSSLISQVYGNSLFIFGGYNGANVLNDFYEFRFEPVVIPPPTLVDDMRRLVNNKDLSDIKFIVEGCTIFASKVHLAARSEHFCAMLYGGMRESTCKEIEIKGVSYEVFLAMLEFLYTDTVSDISPSIAIPLMVVSEQYLLGRLKSLCQDQIRKSISVENVVSIFLAAKRHSAEILKDICLAYILEHLEAVKLERGFQELKQEPDLLMEIILSQ